ADMGGELRRAQRPGDLVADLGFGNEPGLDTATGGADAPIGVLQVEEVPLVHGPYAPVAGGGDQEGATGGPGDSPFGLTRGRRLPLAEVVVAEQRTDQEAS